MVASLLGIAYSARIRESGHTKSVIMAELLDPIMEPDYVADDRGYGTFNIYQDVRGMMGDRAPVFISTVSNRSTSAYGVEETLDQKNPSIIPNKGPNFMAIQ